MLTSGGWGVFTYSVEVSCRGFAGTSRQRILGTAGLKLKKVLNDLAEETE